MRRAINRRIVVLLACVALLACLAGALVGARAAHAQGRCGARCARTS
jgi:hypothetical protein